MESLFKFLNTILAIVVVVSVVFFGTVGFWVSKLFNLHPLACMIGFGVLGIPIGIFVLKFIFRR